MTPDRTASVLAHITANPGANITAIAAATCMTIPMVRDRLSTLSTAGKVHARQHRRVYGYFPGERPELSTRPVRAVSLPPAPFPIPATDHSETAPRGGVISVSGRDGEWLTKRALSRWGGP